MKLFKSKVLYIILIVIFSLILAGTLIIRFALSSGRPSFGGDFNPPAGFSTDSEGKPSFEMPSDFSGEADSATSRERFERPDARSEDGSGRSSSGRRRPSGSSSSFPGRMPGSRNRNAFTESIRQIWIPLVVLSALGDVFSVFMLIRVSKKKKDDIGSTSSGSPDDEDGRSRKPLLFLLVIPILILAIVLKLIPRNGSETSSVEVKEDLITAEAANKELKTVYLSGGTLSESDKISFTVPGDIEIESYAVSNGDSVKEGDLIATVNKTSVMNQISDIKDLIADLDEEIVNSREDDDYKTITAPASGRVMAVYAGKGVSVSDTVASNGALILLSLDGLMKVEINKVDGVSVGDSVKVKLSDSTEKTGRVAQVGEDKITVTIADKKTTLGDKAEVLSADGKSLGSGELQINSCLKITGIQGMVSKISVKTGEYVDAGDDLIKLASKVHSTGYTELTDERKTLTEQMNKLFGIYESGTIKAEASGIISGLDEDIPVEGKTEETVSLNSANTAAILTSASVVSAVSSVYDLLLSAAPKTKEFTQPADSNKSKDSKDSKTTKDTKTTKEDKTSTDSKTTKDSKSSTDSKTTDQTKPSGTDKINVQDPAKQNGGDQTRPSGNSFSSNVTMPDSAKTQAAAQTTTEQTTAQQDQTTSEDDSAYSVEETEIYQILPTESMSIDISVDELDINNLKKGQDATVSLDALPGQSFAGKVTKLANEGTYDSGNTKYAVTVLIDRTEQMYSGMNAGITIETEDPAEYLTVPAAAISDEGGKTWVYTSYDEEKDELTGLTEVVTGKSDGEDVEIVSGIKTGDKVCYKYADTIEYTFMRKS